MAELQKIDCLLRDEQETEATNEKSKLDQSSVVNQYFEMFRRVNRFSIEMVINSGFFITVLMSNMYFIGTTKDTGLTTGVGMGGSIFMLFGTNVQQGLNCALETFIS